MKTKKSLSIMAGLLALGVAGPAVAIADDTGNSGAPGATHTTPLTTPADEQGAANHSTVDEQQTGEQGDVQNTDLATQVEHVDGANGNGGVNEEGQVGDGSNSQTDNGSTGNTNG